MNKRVKRTSHEKARKPIDETTKGGQPAQEIAEDEVEIVVQVNGKVRDRMTMSILASEDEMKAAALANPKIQQLISGKTIRKGSLCQKN